MRLLKRASEQASRCQMLRRRLLSLEETLALVSFHSQNPISCRNDARYRFGDDDLLENQGFHLLPTCIREQEAFQQRSETGICHEHGANLDYLAADRSGTLHGNHRVVELHGTFPNEELRIFRRDDILSGPCEYDWRNKRLERPWWDR
jgi:hypothetical protein